MTSDSEFNSIRPYVNGEIEKATQRLSASEDFLSVFTQLTRMEKIVLSMRWHRYITGMIFKITFSVRQ